MVLGSGWTGWGGEKDEIWGEGGRLQKGEQQRQSEKERFFKDNVR